MLSHFTEYCWLMIGAYLLAKDHTPYAKYICGAMVVVLSIIKIFG